MENQPIQEECRLCEQCKHFRRHYVRSGHGYIPLHKGHCANPHLRDKLAEAPACHRFAKRPGT